MATSASLTPSPITTPPLDFAATINKEATALTNPPFFVAPQKTVTDPNSAPANVKSPPVVEDESGWGTQTEAQKNWNNNPLTLARKPNDWRLRLSLAPGAQYLYKDPTVNQSSDSILFPLIITDGVIFPYTPTIQTSYKASYDPIEPTHSNYKLFFYKNSHVDELIVTAEFTAQDIYEANYMLAVMHFFKSVTKMFYGQDSNPVAGTPPPLCYLNGFGKYQYNNHPVVVQSFSYTLPKDVDYIRAGSTKSYIGSTTLTNVQPKEQSFKNFINNTTDRLTGAKIAKGGSAMPPKFSFTDLSGSGEDTYVPTKLEISLSLLPVVTRYDISNNFSLREYAKGKLTVGTRPGGGGGIW